MSIPKGMFTSTTDLWETPQAFFDQLNTEFCFTLDACALPWNAKCESYYTPEQDGLSQPWTGVVWCNPPYGRQIGKWVEKAAASAADGAALDAATVLSTFQTENEKLQKMYQEEKVVCHEIQLELERMKKIMRENGIMVIPSEYPGSTEKWNIQKPRDKKEEL